MFPPEQTAELTGSDALTQRRRAAAERAVEVGLPTFEEEVWRYSPIDDLDLGRYRLGQPDGDLVPPGVTAGITDAAAVVTIVNGRLADLEVNDDAVDIVLAAEGDDTVIGSVMTSAVDVFGDMNLAFTATPVAVGVKAGAVVETPIVVRHVTDADDLAWFPRTVVRAGENSECVVVEHHASSDVASLVVPVTEIDVAQAARCRHLTVQELGPRMWQLGTEVSDIGRDAHLATSQVALGGGYARMRIDTRLVGQGASGDINAVYFGRGDSSLDFRTFQTHVAPHTDSNLLFKGAVDDRSRAIYTGLIRIEPEASAVAAYQTNRNLKLSDEAWAESVPNLEIENNDVRCSHASAIGPVDSDQVFYLESRGVPPRVARTLVVRGFFTEVLDALPVPEVAAATAERLAGLLAAHDDEGVAR